MKSDKLTTKTKMKKQLLKLMDTSGKNETLALRTDIDINRNERERKKPESVKKKKKSREKLYKK